MGILYKSEGTLWSLHNGESSIVPMCKISGEIEILKIENNDIALLTIKDKFGKTVEFSSVIARKGYDGVQGIAEKDFNKLNIEGIKYVVLYEISEGNHFDNTNRLFEILDKTSYDENNLEICEIYQDENQVPQKSFLEQNYISILIFGIGIILGILIGIILRKIFLKKKL